MPTREQKETTIQELEGIFERAQVAIVTDYRGLTVKEITDLRRRLQKVGGELTVAKNTLVDRVTRGNDSWKAIEPLLAGPTALAIGFEDPVAAAKVVADFAKEKRKVEIKVRGGVLEGKALDAEGVKALASMPSKEVLLSRLLGSLQSPAQKLASALSGGSRNLVYALDAVRREKESA
ncbi:MAG: 50S ribosomal protein L10 [bacterium]|jgi:large subunit ribosomal protein L10|nr:50S ribosomal protein L10 [bacterium]